MSTDQILGEAFSIIGNKIEQNRFNDIVENVINSLINKYGKDDVARYAGSNDSSEINNVLTHVIEVGSLKLMKDGGLIVNNSALMDKCFATAAIMSFSIAPILKSKGVFKHSRDCYFTMDGVEIIANRIYQLCGTHINFDKMPQSVKNDTFTVDELFSFYLGEYYEKTESIPFLINSNAISSSVNYGSIADEKRIADELKKWGNYLFNINNTSLKVSHNGKTVFKSELQLVEQDGLHETFIGNFNSFQKFRFLKTAAGAAAVMSALHNKQLFTIASVLPHGFAVTYEY